MVCLVSRGIFKAGHYSSHSSRLLRLVGQPRCVSIAEFSIKPVSRSGRRIGNEWHNTVMPPYLPQKATDEFHPSGNSLGYALQWAHLMEADPIYLIGFTLQSGSGYDWGPNNPVTGRPNFYDTPRIMDFCRFFEEKYPGRVRLSPGYQGPVYDIFKKADW